MITNLKINLVFKKKFIIIISIIKLKLFFKKFFKKNDLKKNKKISRNFWYKGSEELRIKNYKDALNYFSKAIELDDKNKEAYLDRGKVRKYLKDYENAIKDFSIAIELYVEFLDKKPYMIDFLKVTLLTAYKERGSCKEFIGDYEGASEDVLNFLDSIDNSSTDLDGRNAFEQFDALKISFNGFKDNFFNLGDDLNLRLINIYTNYLTPEIKEQLLEDLSNQIEKNPNNSNLLINRGKKNYYFGYENAALKDYSKVIEIDPSNEEALWERGVLKMNIKNYHGAIEDFTKVIKINPKDRWAKGYLAQSKLLSKDYEFSQKDFEKLMNRLSSGPGFSFKKNYIDKETTKEYQEDFKNYYKLINLTKDNDLFDKKDFKKLMRPNKYKTKRFTDSILLAIKEIDNSINFLEKDPSFLSIKKLTEEGKKKNNEIRECIEEGDEKFKSENYQDAIDAYSEALKLNPENEEVLKKRSEVYKKLSELDIDKINDFDD